jgi:hypothetical protein
MQLDQCWRENNYIPYSTSKAGYRDVPVPDYLINFISYTQSPTNSFKNNIFILLNKQFILSCVILSVLFSEKWCNILERICQDRSSVLPTSDQTPEKLVFSLSKNNYF